MPHECETCMHYREPWDGPHCIHCGWQELWQPCPDQDPDRQTAGSSGADSAVQRSGGKDFFVRPVVERGTAPEEGRCVGETEEMEA